MLSLIQFNSSSKSSASSAYSVQDVMNQWGNSTISSCILGISKIGTASNLSYKFSHAALLLLDSVIDYDNENEQNFQERLGILIEYGDYSPNMCPTEQEYVDKGLVIYRYGEKGGLRYYGNKYQQFIETFGNIGYIDLDIHPNYQMTFHAFLEKIANVDNNMWIKGKYYVGLSGNFNCHNFAIEALKVLNPNFNFANINPRDDNLIKKKKYIQKLEFVPENIRKVLVNYYVKSK